jgi:hypothetical protein
MLRGLSRYLNSASRRSLSFCTASCFWPSQSTTLMSRIHGTRPRTTSSHPFLPGHTPSISPPDWTRICLAFRPPEVLSAATSSFNFLFCRRAALAALSAFPVLPTEALACAGGGQHMPGYGIEPGADCIIQGSCGGIDPGPEDINHGTYCDGSYGGCIHGQLGYVEAGAVPVSNGHVLGKAVAGADAASGAGAAIIRRPGGCKLFLFFGPAATDEPCPVLTSSSSESEMSTW